MVKKLGFLVLILTGLYTHSSQVLTPVNTLLTVFENETNDADYKVFVGTGQPRFLLVQNSSIDLSKKRNQLKNSIRISDRMRIDMICVRGERKALYIKFGTFASGQCEKGKGPFYISIWEEFPDTPELNRTYVRYCQDGEVGELGLKITKQGKVEIFAVKNTTIIE